MLYRFYKFWLFVLRATTLRAAYLFTSFFARVQYAVSKKDREIVKENLRRAMPGASDNKISATAKDVFVNFGKYLVDFFSLGKNLKEHVKKTVRFVNINSLDDALKLGKGCILVTGHFGNWELSGCALASLGYKINVVALDHADERINNLFIGQRKMAGMRVMRIGTARAACQRALEQAEAVGIMGDRPFGDRGVEIDFFGKTAIFPRGAALFSIKYGSPIVMFFTYKDDTGSNKYTIYFEKPLFAEQKKDVSKQLIDIAQAFAKKFEHHIRKHPSQWYMFNKVWKDQ